jgi:membrane-bound lytic murein transglycosylase A
MVAQDTGGAIKGTQRADIFFGTGDTAGEAAGTIKDGGRMIVLLPIDRAFATLLDQ